MDAAQQRMKAYYDQSKVDASYNPDDMVMLHTRNLRRGPGSKLLPKWLGPYAVDHMVGKAAVKLKLPSSLRIHPTFHVSLIKKYHAEPGQPVPLAPVPLVLDTDGEPIWSVDHIVTHREVRRRANRRSRRYRTFYEYKVRWSGCSEADDSWQQPSDFADNGASILAYWRQLNIDPPSNALPSTSEPNARS